MGQQDVSRNRRPLLFTAGILLAAAVVGIALYGGFGLFGSSQNQQTDTSASAGTSIDMLDAGSVTVMPDDSVESLGGQSGNSATTSSDARNEPGLNVTFVSPDEFLLLVDEGRGVVLDVRTSAKTDMFEMPWDAVSIPMAHLEIRSEEIPSSDRILLVASNDDETIRAVERLDALGVPPGAIQALSGGTDQWIAEGRPYTFNPHIVAC